MQWMTMISFVPSHAIHAPQHAAASPFGPLNSYLETDQNTNTSQALNITL